MIIYFTTEPFTYLISLFRSLHDKIFYFLSFETFHRYHFSENNMAANEEVEYEEKNYWRSHKSAKICETSCSFLYEHFKNRKEQKMSSLIIATNSWEWHVCHSFTTSSASSSFFFKILFKSCHKNGNHDLQHHLYW